MRSFYQCYAFSFDLKKLIDRKIWYIIKDYFFINDKYQKSNIVFIVWFNLLNGIILYMTIATKMVDLYVSSASAIPMSNVSFFI